MTSEPFMSPDEAWRLLKCTPLHGGALIDAGKIGAWHDRVTGAWRICAGSVRAYLRQPTPTAALQDEVAERAEAQQAEVIRLSERTWNNVRNLT